MRVRSIVGAFAAAAAVSLAVAGCNTVGQNQGVGTSEEVRLYGTDGNMANSFGDAFKDEPGILAGMKGTLPLTPLSEDFKRRMKLTDPNLTDFNYSAESYDAVVIAALAAEVAKTVEPPSIAKQIVGVTNGDMACDTIATCLTAAKAGRRIRYKGVSLRRSGLSTAGEPSTAMYGVVSYGRDNRLEDAKTEYVSAGDEKGESKTAPPAAAPANGKSNKTPLKIGILLPKTGALGFQGPPMFAGVRLAVKEINEAGGVLGAQVALEDGDDGTSPDVANATVDRLIAAGVHVIIGAGASGVSKAVLPKVIAASRLMISPSATSDELTSLDDKGLFFRTSPPDVLQAKALTDIVMRDGHTKIAIIARDDSYGKGLANNVQNNLQAAGIKAANLKVQMYKGKDSFDPKVDLDSVFNPIARQVKSFGADGILLIGFDESALVIKALVGVGVKVRT
jgi:ABC-type branched-subunit amino acid transport system substrate-binding protein